MALLKTFTSGERLFASDLNGNFEDLDGRVVAIENAALAVETAGSDTVNLNFFNDRLVSRTAAGNITFTGSNYTSGKSITVRVIAGASSRDLTFPEDWKFVSLKPTSLAEDETGILTATCFGTAASDVVAAWAWSG